MSRINWLAVIALAFLLASIAASIMAGLGIAWFGWIVIFWILALFFFGASRA